MARKPHPADIANAQIITLAVRFDVALFLGAGRYATASATSLEAAKREADRLVAEHPNGRPALIYGVTAEGRSGLITPTMMETEMAKTTKKASTKSAAKSKAKAKAKPAKKTAAARPANGKGEPKAKPFGKRAAIIAAAQAGKLPPVPDFSAATHTRFRPKLEEVVALAKASDLKGLRAFKYEGFMSTSPRAIMRYRDLCIIALSAKQA
jgi:hypothetical protein